jgi:hypothetical protein
MRGLVLAPALERTMTYQLIIKDAAVVPLASLGG